MHTGPVLLVFLIGVLTGIAAVLLAAPYPTSASC